MDDKIPTGERRVTVALKCGGVATVRRLRRTTRTDIMGVAKVGLAFSAGDLLRFQDIGCRAALVHVEGLRDLEDGGEAVPWSTERHPLLGEVAEKSVYNALTHEDIVCICRESRLMLDLVQSPMLSEEQSGN